jgi:hypothetical protein
MANMSTAAAVVAWDDTFRRWAKPMSDSEEAMADRAAGIIRTAISASAALAARSVDVYATGSYHNNTNVRGESDIDVAVVCHDTFFYDLPAGAQAAPFGLVNPATYTFDQFRREVHAALYARFGAAGMTPGAKAFTVHENTYRLEADVSPFFEYRLYDANGSYNEGVKSISANGTSFVNWHKDHYTQGVARNLATGRRFKRVARILKNVKFDMTECGTAHAKEVGGRIPSFLIECLVFNAQDACFKLSTQGYVQDVRAVIADIWDATKAEADRWRNMVEVNWRKWLFRGGQSWTRELVHDFLTAAWGHLFRCTPGSRLGPSAPIETSSPMRSWRASSLATRAVTGARGTASPGATSITASRSSSTCSIRSSRPSTTREPSM